MLRPHWFSLQQTGSGFEPPTYRLFSLLPPRVYLSSRHDASFPLRAIADIEAQTNKCGPMDRHMVYVHTRVSRASLFAERVLLTTKSTHGFSTAAPQHAKGGEKRAGRKDDGSYITNTPGLTLIVQHFNAARLIWELASSRKNKTHTHTHAQAKNESELSSFELRLISEITWTVQKY